MSTFSCLDCPDREVGCHSKCEKYQRDLAEHKRLKDIRYRNNLALGRSIEVMFNHKDYEAKRKKFIRRG